MVSIEQVNNEFKLVIWDDEPTLEMPFSKVERDWFRAPLQGEITPVKRNNVQP
jgi:hypothetical protein